MEKIENWKSLSRLQQLEYYEKHSWIPIPAPDVGYKITLTHRYVKWLLTLAYLQKKEKIKYHHYLDITNVCENMFGIRLSSYARLNQAPWNLIMAENEELYKPHRSGFFKLSKKGRDFINGRIEVPQTVLFIDNEYQIIGDEYIKAHQAKDVNFLETINLLKTY